MQEILDKLSKLKSRLAKTEQSIKKAIPKQKIANLRIMKWNANGLLRY